ncbi:hypothetical protein SARC_12871 [Sphaeroforma arctica JP610]|uniref:Uncharacterized protein n=1 Tax=Sphaeroforma arctica JP610 TaxID=667725 RepID=A0A0L0FDQ9_9EUKA|nr:hypothetical protein SARC_12871 [Sphaeroforma arctica JP610]KNC74586.1 hypothetical protein SARC_12871 [Sphaeroforma arctica JP610]|eukprot:XP_014148488.1 hypothetical protein SARC_12871 [Sphaeroforma arctica JP610]
MTSLDLNLEDSSHAQDNAHSHSPAEQAEEADYGKPHSRNPSLQNGRISKRKGPTSTELLDFSTSALDGGGCTGRGSDVEELPPRKKSRIKARTQTDKGRAYIQKKINGHLGTTAHMGKLQRKPEVVNKNQSVRSEAAVRAITHTRMPKHRGLNKGARKVYQSRLAFEPVRKT